jgi:DNA topoisomerase-1
MTETNCFDILPGDYSREELEKAMPDLKLYVESLYTGPGKIENVDKNPVIAYFSDRIDNIQICVKTSLSKKYKEIINKINSEIQTKPEGSYGIDYDQKSFLLGIPSTFSPIEVSKLSEIIKQSDKDTERRFKTLTTKGSFFDDKYPYDDLLFDYQENGEYIRARFIYDNEYYELNETEHEIASLFAKQLYMQLSDKGYFSNKDTGKTKKSNVEKENFIKTFWNDFTKGVYYKRKIKKPCISCDETSDKKYCWAPNIREIKDFSKIDMANIEICTYMTKNHSKIFTDYKKADFSEFIKQIDFISERKKNKKQEDLLSLNTDDLIKSKKDEIIRREEQKHNRTYALVDDRREPLGKVTPMLLRIFTGSKSNLYSPGQITAKIEPEDCVLNICGGNIPEPPPGRCWGAVICNPNVKIVVWFKPIVLNNNNELTVVSDGSITFGELSLISSKDKLFKFEKARKLNMNIELVRKKYSELIDSDNSEQQQLGVIIFLLDHYGFRGGGEQKSSVGEDDGIGVTTLPLSSIKEIKKNCIHLRFLGKSGILFDEIIKIPNNSNKELKKQFTRVLYLIGKFISGRANVGGDDTEENIQTENRVFNLVNLGKVNQYLQTIDSLFSAKVFRTRLASSIMFDCLNTDELNIKQGDNKKLSKQKFDSCNKTVAVALNHKKKITVSQQTKLAKMLTNIDLLKKKKQNTTTEENEYNITKQIWEVSLGTSVKNYIDPRIIVSWAKNQSYDWDDDTKGKSSTVDTLDDLYLLPQMKFVQAKTEEEGGGAVTNPEFIWAVESVNREWDWLTSPLLIPNLLIPQNDDLSTTPSIKSKIKPLPRVSPSPRIPPLPRIPPSHRVSPSPSIPPSPRIPPLPRIPISHRVSPSPRIPPSPRVKFRVEYSDDSSDSDPEDDIPIFKRIETARQEFEKEAEHMILEEKVHNYLKNIPGTNLEFNHLLNLCQNNNFSKLMLLTVNLDILKWLYPFCKYACQNIPDSHEMNCHIVNIVNEMK